MSQAEQILKSAASVLVVDWTSPDVPETLAHAGYTVVVKGGPGPQDYSARELSDGELVARPLGRPPATVDLVYCHRPLQELPGIVALAQGLGARAVWSQSGLASEASKDPKGCWVPEESAREARELVQAAGLEYVDDVYIAEAVRRLEG